MKVGRNDPCLCASGEKYKKCCGPKHSPIPNAPSCAENRRWVEDNVIKDGDVLLYGSLQYEIGDIPQDELWRELRRAAEIYFAGGQDRIRIVHRLIDETIESLIERDRRLGYAAPYCHRGCCNCCHELVYCTQEEAWCIAEYCTSSSIEIDHEKLLRQLDHVEFDLDMNHSGGSTWNDQHIADQSCVFLDSTDGSCAIWPVRPAVCRAHLAEETADYCAPHNGIENPDARGISHVELSYILSAIFTINRDSIKKTMGRLLLDSRPEA